MLYLLVMGCFFVRHIRCGFADNLSEIWIKNGNQPERQPLTQAADLKWLALPGTSRNEPV
jgi:hypothetical protein